MENKFEDSRHLEIGAAYKVVAEDCCLNVYFTGVFKGYYDENDKPVTDITEGFEYALWNNGVKIGPDWGCWKCELIR